MNEQTYNERLRDREFRYPGWHPISDDLQVHISVDREYGATFAGQVAALTVASLVGRMCKNVAMEVPALEVHEDLPWANADLEDVVMRTLLATDKYGNHAARSAHPGDLRIQVGRTGDGMVVHGSGWSSYCGTSSSPLPTTDEVNPFGAAFAVLAAASKLHEVTQSGAIDATSIDTFLWRDGVASPTAPRLEADFDVGRIVVCRSRFCG